MTTDFADRPASRKKPGRKAPTRKTRSRATPTKQRTRFHSPSFSFGALFGATVILLVAYTPELLDTLQASPESSETAATSSSTPSVTFEFPDLLRGSEVRVDGSTYGPATAQTPAGATATRLQAASFRQQKEANAMRAKLLLLDFPCSIELVEKDGETWHRVIVGPFERQVDLDRAMTRLREQNISAIRLGD